VDLAGRRPPASTAGGPGAHADAFQRAVDGGRIGHVGLSESAVLAALGSGLDVDEVEEEAEMVPAPRDLAGPVPVARGAARASARWRGRGGRGARWRASR